MIRLLCILLLSAASAAAWPANFYVPIESGNPGDVVNAAYLTADDVGTAPGTWTVTDSEGTDTPFVAADSQPLLKPVTIGGTTYTGVGTRSIRFSHAVSSPRARMSVTTPSTNVITWSGWIKDTSSMAGFNDIVQFVLSSGPSATLQLQNGRLLPHTDFGAGGGPYVTISSNTWYWVVVKAGPNQGMDVWVYNADGSLRGQATWPIGATSGGVQSIAFGNINPHGSFKAGDIYFDNVVVSLATGSGPVAPVGVPFTYYVRTDGDNASTGLANTAGGAWRTIDYATSTSPGVEASDIVRVQAGTYNESVTVDISGSAGYPITYVADGTVTTRAFLFSARSYIRIVGFYGNGNATIEDFSSMSGTCTGIELWHNTVTGYTDNTFEVDPNAAAISNNCMYIGNLAVRGPPGAEDSLMSLRGADNMISHNTLSEADEDFVYLWGQRNRFQNNYGYGSNAASSAHVDFLQTGSGTAGAVGNSHLLVESNFYVDSVTPADHHHWSNMSTSDFLMSHIIYRRNVGVAIGTNAQNIFWDEDGTLENVYLYNDTYYQAATFEPSNNAPFRILGQGRIWNSIFVDAWGSSVTSPEVFTGGTMPLVSEGYNLGYDSSGTVTFGSNFVSTGTLTNSNPLFVDPGNQDFRLQSGSPAANSAGALTTVTSSGGTGTAFVVGDAGFFRGDNTTIAQYGGNLVVGDTITVGTDVVEISSIDYATNTITAAASFTWANGDEVRFGNHVADPFDRGAFPSGHVPLSSATYNQSGTTYTCTPVGDVRWVIFYRDGIPYVVDNAAPYSATIASGTVTARAYAMFASKVPWVQAASGAPDTTAPVPNPMTFASVPAAVDASSATMTASIATDAVSSAIEYYFDETTGAAGGTDSGWQSERGYVDSGLSPSTLYAYRVRARDASLNETSYSSSSNVTTAPSEGGQVDCDTINVTTLRVGP